MHIEWRGEKARKKDTAMGGLHEERTGKSGDDKRRLTEKLLQEASGGNGEEEKEASIEE